MSVIMCGFHGCHVIDCNSTQECDCTKCPSSIPHSICEKCEKFMGKARRSIWFSGAAIKKCEYCMKEAANKL
jgi:hypothetical protein